MTRYVFFILFFLFLTACNSSRSDKIIAANQSDSMGTGKSDTAIRTKKFVKQANPDTVRQTNADAVVIDEDNIQKAIVLKSDSSVSLTSNSKLDYRIFGYDKPDTSSKKLILLSVFTSDVEGNPFRCPYGSYYQTSDMNDMELRYTATEGQFIKANILKTSIPVAIIYIDKKWIEFE